MILLQNRYLSVFFNEGENMSYTGTISFWLNLECECRPIMDKLFLNEMLAPERLNFRQMLLFSLLFLFEK